MSAFVPLTPRIGVSGYCPQLEALAMRGGAWRVVRFPAAWLLVEHPQHGPVAVDTGYGSAAAAMLETALGKWYGRLAPMRWTPEVSTTRVLQRHGVSPAQVRHVVITHWHADHAGGLPEFPNALVHTDAAALAHLRALAPRKAAREGYFPQFYPQALETRTRGFGAWQAAPSWLAPFEHAAPVFDDDSLWVVPLPGHARGQVGVAGREAAGNVWLWAADAAWRAAAYVRGALPPSFVLRLACPRPSDYAQSLERVASFARRSSARVAVAHDESSWNGWGRL
jgi:glyoxylase-like metal-dependent hydrolase (beta-lactamase superfamily II)